MYGINDSAARDAIRIDRHIAEVWWRSSAAAVAWPGGDRRSVRDNQRIEAVATVSTVGREGDSRGPKGRAKGSVEVDGIAVVVVMMQLQLGGGASGRVESRWLAGFAAAGAERKARRLFKTTTSFYFSVSHDSMATSNRRHDLRRREGTVAVAVACSCISMTMLFPAVRRSLPDLDRGDSGERNEGYSLQVHQGYALQNILSFSQAFISSCSSDKTTLPQAWADNRQSHSTSSR